MKKIILSLSVLLYTLCLQNGWAQTTHFTENFSSGSLPSGWTNDSLGLPASNIWIFNNQYNRNITGAAFDTSFAIFDSDEGSTNDGFNENSSLTTPPINIATATGVLSLEFDEQYHALGGPNTNGSSRRVELSSDGGITWNTIVYDSVNVGYPNPAAHTAINISSVIGAPAVQVRFTWTGSYDWWWAIDNVQIKSFAGCTSAPIAGNAVSSNSQVCSGVNFTLSLSGADSGIVISYQWQSSADNVNWNNIPGAVSPTLSTNITSATYYRCVLTCSGFSSNSASVLVGLKPTLLCYCSTNLGGAICPSNDFIRNVTITGTTLNNSDTICNFNNGSNLSVFSPAGSATAVLTRGSTYSLSVTTSSNNIISVWIDYDQNGTYEPNEWNQVCTTSVANTVNTINMDIPYGIPGGQTGMRVRSRATGNPNADTSACMSFGSGETEDYIVTIDIGTDISTPVKENILNVVPNPATSKLIISFVNYTSENAALNLLNLNGQVVYTEKISQPDGNYSKTLDISSFAKGIYNLQLISKSGIINKKIVIE